MSCRLHLNLPANYAAILPCLEFDIEFLSDPETRRILSFFEGSSIDEGGKYYFKKISEQDWLFLLKNSFRLGFFLDTLARCGSCATGINFSFTQKLFDTLPAPKRQEIVELVLDKFAYYYLESDDSSYVWESPLDIVENFCDRVRHTHPSTFPNQIFTKFWQKCNSQLAYDDRRRGAFDRFSKIAFKTMNLEVYKNFLEGATHLYLKTRIPPPTLGYNFRIPYYGTKILVQAEEQLNKEDPDQLRQETRAEIVDGLLSSFRDWQTVEIFFQRGVYNPEYIESVIESDRATPLEEILRIYHLLPLRNRIAIWEDVLRSKDSGTRFLNQYERIYQEDMKLLAAQEAELKANLA